MTNFFDKFDKTSKFNLVFGDFLNKIIGFPTKAQINENILSEIRQPSRAYIKDITRLSQVVQAYLDDVIDTKYNLIKEINNNYSGKFNTNLEIYSKIIKNEMFTNFISFNFDTIVDKNFKSSLNIVLPSDEEIKINPEKKSYFKVFGDISDVTNAFISSQDIKKLKLVPMYKKFFSEIRKNLAENPTILLGIDFEDGDVCEMLEYILAPLENYEPIYIITDGSIIPNRAMEFKNKFNIKIIPETAQDFHEFFVSIPKLQERNDAQKKFSW